MKCQSCNAVLSGPTCEFCGTICEKFLDRNISQKLEEEKQEALTDKERMIQKLEKLQNAYTGAGAPIESQKKQRLYDFLFQKIGLLKFFVGDKKLIPTEEREQILRDFFVPATEKPIAIAVTSGNRVDKTGLIFGLNGIYTHNKSIMLKHTAAMPYKEFKRLDIRAKSRGLKDFVYIGDDFIVNLRGQIHLNFAKSLQALQEIV